MRGTGCDPNTPLWWNGPLLISGGDGRAATADMDRLGAAMGMKPCTDLAIRFGCSSIFGGAKMENRPIRSKQHILFHHQYSRRRMNIAILGRGNMGGLLAELSQKLRIDRFLHEDFSDFLPRQTNIWRGGAHRRQRSYRRNFAVAQRRAT